jgi:transcriptional regulator with XRE-family HTH domain
MVDAARGNETYASLAFRLGESEQWLSNKLRGARKIDVPEVVRLGAALDIDPVELVMARWPELRAVDRMARLRVILAGATASELAALEQVAAQMMRDRTAPRSKSRGRR